MNAMLNKRLALVALLGAACAGAQAQTSEVYLQNATSYGIGNTIYIYSLPTKKAADGKMTYWDVQLTLEADDSSGKPNKATFASAVKSPSIKKSEFVTGSFVSTDGAKCTLTASPFSGRTEYELSCNGGAFLVDFYTGAISGHPYEADLKNAKLDTIVGSSEYSWGRIVYNTGSWWFGCFNTPELLSARQNGDTLTLINWGGNAVEDCRMNFIFKQP